MLGYTIISNSLNLLFYEEKSTDYQACINFDKMLNYCNEYETRTLTGKPLWVSIVMVAGGSFVMSVYFPNFLIEYRKLRYGLKSTWDDEFRR